MSGVTKDLGQDLGWFVTRAKVAFVVTIANSISSARNSRRNSRLSVRLLYLPHSSTNSTLLSRFQSLASLVIASVYLDFTFFRSCVRFLSKSVILRSNQERTLFLFADQNCRWTKTNPISSYMLPSQPILSMIGIDCKLVPYYLFITSTSFQSTQTARTYILTACSMRVKPQESGRTDSMSLVPLSSSDTPPSTGRPFRYILSSAFSQSTHLLIPFTTSIMPRSATPLPPPFFCSLLILPLSVLSANQSLLHHISTHRRQTTPSSSRNDSRSPSRPQGI